MGTKDVADHCFHVAARTLRRRGYETLYDQCGNAATALRECLQRRGVPAELVARRFPGGQGRHFTVKTPGGELDPSIAFWPRRASQHGQVTRPMGATPNALYRVGKGSPHSRWRKEPVDEANMYACYLPGIQRRRG